MLVDIFNFVGIYPELLLLSSVLFFISYFVICDSFFKNQLILIYINLFLFLLTLFWFFLLSLNTFFIDFMNFYSLFLTTKFTFVIILFLTGFVFALLLVSKVYLKDEKILNYEFIVLIMLSFLGLILVSSSYDLLSIYLSLELQTLCFYILATFKQYSNFSTEAGLKYFIIGAFSSGLILFGLSFLYGFTGSTDFYSISLLIQTKNIDPLFFNGILLGNLFLIVGLLFKLTAAPFHMWAPDVYEGSPTVVTAFFSIIPKLAIWSLLIKLSLIVFYHYIYITNFFFLISIVFSLILGSFGALYQVKIKRLLAYSSISHIGFLLIGICLMSIHSLYASLFYLFVYMLLLLFIFTCLLNLRKNRLNISLNKLGEFRLLLNFNPVLAMSFSVILFSMAGIPPLVGFYTKFYIFLVSLSEQLYFIIIIAACLSVLSAMYYIRFIKLIFFKRFFLFSFFDEISLPNSLLLSFILLLNINFLFFSEFTAYFFYNIILSIF